MNTSEPLQNSKELEFVVFCVENVDARLDVGGEKVCKAFTEKKRYFEWIHHTGIGSPAYAK